MSSRFAAGALVTSVLVGAVREAAAQVAAPASIDSVPLIAGARVRVTATPLGPTPTVHRFAGTRSDTLLLRRAAGTSVDTTAIALSAVTRIEQSRGWRQHALVGGGVGAVIGAAIGALAGYNASEDTRTPCGDCSVTPRGAFAVSTGFQVAGVVGAVGALIGRFVVGERWQLVAGR